MVDFDNFTINDWVAIYNLLAHDNHLSKEGLEELERLKK